MKTLLFALCAGLLPLGLSVGLLEAAGPGRATGLVEPGAGTLHLALACAVSLLLFLAYRLRTGAMGPGLVAAAFWSAFPAVTDAVASSQARPGLLIAVAGAVLLVVASMALRGGGQSHRAALVAAVVALADLGRAMTTDSLGAAALHPSTGLGFVVAVIAAEAVNEWILRGGADSGRGRFMAAGLVAVLVASGGLSNLAARSWESPRAFWARAVDERPDSLAALGAFAREAESAGDREGSTRALRRFVLAVEKGAGRDLSGPRERTLAALGAAEAAAGIIVDEKAPEDARSLAGEVLSAAMDLDPDTPAVLRVVGMALYRTGDLVEAVQLLRRAVTEDPRDAAAWNALARALLDVPRVGDALAAAAQAAGLEPDNREYATVRAWALYENGLDGEALILLNDMLGSPPDVGVAQALAEISFRVAEKEVSGGRKNRARRLLMRALQVWPFHHPAKALLESLNADMEEELGPEKLGRFMPVEGQPSLPDNIIVWATALSRWGEYERAGPYWKLLETQLPGNAQLLYLIGREFHEVRGTREGLRNGISYYRNAIAVDGRHAEARNALWQALRRLGDHVQAADAARKFLEVAPGHPDALSAERYLEGR